jgi:site-specific recombinase XerD
LRAACSPAVEISGSASRRDAKRLKPLSSVPRAEIAALKQEYVSSALSSTTVGNYQRSANDYEEWCKNMGVQPWPVNIENVEDFTTCYIKIGLYASVRNAWSGIQYISKTRFDTELRQSIKLKALHRKASAFAADNAKPLREPLSREALHAFVVRRPAELTPRQYLQAKAIVLLGIRALLRPGEISKLRFEHVKFNHQGIMYLDLGVRKNKLERSPRIYVSTSGTDLCPVAAFLAWREFCIQERKCCAQDQLVFTTSRGSAVSNAHIADYVRVVMKNFGGENMTLAGHCLRITGACFLLEAGEDVASIKLLGNWSSDCFLRYLRTIVHVSTDLTRRMGL